MKKKKKSPLNKERLLEAIQATYADSCFFVGVGTEEIFNFGEGLMNNRSEFWTKALALEAVQAFAGDEITSVPEFSDYLVLSPALYISKRSIIDNKEYHTPATEGYIHLVCKYNPHFDVYIKMDWKKPSISFRLGAHEKTLPIIIDTSGTCHATRSAMYCGSLHNLDKFIHDEFWKPAMITVGRHVLQIPNML